MADLDRTESRILFWDSLHRRVLDISGEKLDELGESILRRTIVRLSLESEMKDAEEFPLWDLRPLLELIVGELDGEQDCDRERIADLVGHFCDDFSGQIIAALGTEKAREELAAYADTINDDDIASFEELRGLLDADYSESEGDLAVDEAEDGLDDMLGELGGEMEGDDLLAELAGGEVGEGELAEMADLLPAEGEFERMAGIGELAGAAEDAFLDPLDAAEADFAAEESPEDEALMAELADMDLSKINDSNLDEVLSKAGLTESEAEDLDVATYEARSILESSPEFAMESDDADESLGAESLSAEALASLEHELADAEALAQEEEEVPASKLSPVEAKMTAQDLVRARMIRISESVEELSENTTDRAIVQNLIDHFGIITRPITRMGYRTFGSLSDALVTALIFVRDNEIEAPPSLCNNLRELVTTLAEVVEGRWSKYKTFYWLINKLNSTMRQMEELVEQRDEEMLWDIRAAQEEEDVEDQIRGREKEIEGRQRVELTDLQEIFVQEANEHIDLLNRNLLLAERHPDDQEIIYALMRSAHSIKGSANISKFPEIGSLGHAMEDVMEAIRDNTLAMTPAIIDLMLTSVDLLQGMLAGVEYADEYDQAPVEDLKKKLNALAEELKAHPDKYRQAAEKIDAELEKTVGLKASRKQLTEADKRSDADRAQANTVRVDYESLNLLLNQAAELVINRTRLSGQIESFRSLIDWLNSEKKRLRGTEHRLDRTIEEVSHEMGNFLNSGKTLTTHTGNGEAQILAGRLNQVRIAMSRLLRIRESGMLVEFSDAEFDRFSELDVIWRDLRESVTHIDDVVDQLEVLSANLDQNISRISLIANDLHEQIMRIRMLPVGRIFNRFPRTVRDMSRQLEKQIELRMSGEETPLDKTIIEDLTDPMIHLVRNACDHGIESPAEREEMAKEATGTIWLDARQEGNQVVIEIRDDGRGIDIESIKKRAIERRMMTEEQVNRASEAELVNLIFAPGFSTAAKTTDISGRGVGMDVVKTAIMKLKGSVSVSTELAEGTTFTIRLPLTLAISQALLFNVSNTRAAIQLSAVDETIMIREDSIMRTMGTEIIKLRDEILPILRLNEVLSLGAPEESSGERPVIIINTGNNRRVGVVVDRLIGREEIVVKNLGSHLKNVRFVSGGTILGDGAVTLILDITAIVDQVKPLQSGEVSYRPDDSSQIGFDMESYKQAVEGAREKVAAVDLGVESSSPDMGTPDLHEVKPQRSDAGQPHVLVTDDSISIRRFVGSILESAGYRVTLANDGVDAMEKLKTGGRFDLILTDLEMPRMHGYELIAEVKQNIAYKNIPIIILTGRAGEKHSRKGMELGAAAFLVKPFNEEELLSEISRNLHRSPA